MVSLVEGRRPLQHLHLGWRGLFHTFGVGLPDENAHAPNERLDLGNFHNGVVASAILYDEIAKIQRP